MARNPADRYQHAREITQDLKKVGRLIKDDPGAAGAVKLRGNRCAAPALAPVRAPRVGSRWSDGFFNWPLSRHAIALGIAALVSGSASAAVGWWLRPKDPLETPVNPARPHPARSDRAEAIRASQPTAFR